MLVIRIVCPSIGNIIKHLFSVQAVPLRNSKKANGAESPLRVNVQALPLSATHVYRQLTRNGERVAKLRLACPELPKEFSDCTSLDATLSKCQYGPGLAMICLTTQECIEVLGSGCYVHKL